MNIQRILSENPFGRDHVIYTDDKMVVRRSMDRAVFDELMRQNGDSRNCGQEGYTPSKDMQRIASIPIVVWADWVKKYGAGFHRDQKLLRQLINDHDYFKTISGNV